MAHNAASPDRPFVIGLSGRIGAGKSTAAHWAEQHGFTQTRISLVIDDEIRKLGLSLERSTRQRIGLDLHHRKGQAWLCEAALARVSGTARIVVDGLRWPDDHTFFADRFRERFMHIHIEAPADVRYRRLAAGGLTWVEFEAIDDQPVEAMIGSLRDLAASRIENLGSLAQFHSSFATAVLAAVAETA